MPANPLMPDWKKIKAQIAEIAKIAGARQLVKLALEEQAAQTAAMAQIKLPAGFHFFTEGDWMGYAGSTSFLNGIEPVIGNVPVDVGGCRMEATCIISADEGNRTSATIGLMIYQGGNDEDDEQNTFFSKDVGSLEEALGFVDMLQRIQGDVAIPLETLQRVGFKE